jgi:glycosyltransferase involved in cell wall biosynthesis
MEPVENSGANPVGVSVVICCHNGAARLPETLKHLARQAVPASIPWEVIVVDNASTDDTANVAARVWREAGAPAPLCLLEEARPGRSFALQTGFTAARYGVLVLVDDDNWLNPDYLERAFRQMCRHPEMGILGGKITAAFEAEPPRWFPQYQSWYAVGPQGKTSGDITGYKSHVAGAGMVVRKPAHELLKQKGFQPLLSGGRSGNLTVGEDMELCYAMMLIGYRIWYDEQLQLTHFMPKERLTRANLIKLISWERFSDPVLACYEAALRRPDDSVLMIYLRDMRKRGGWALKSAVKLLLGRHDWMACRLQWLEFWNSLVSLPELRRVFKLHHPEMLKLKSGVAAK